jgi:hypothetical protein
MRDQYYADNLDLVKWGILLMLAERYAAKHILQVLYYRPSEWADLEIDGEMVRMPDAVIQHFRNATAITGLRSPAQIEVIADTFSDRREYLRTVTYRIQARPNVPCIVFLDPDTGLEPQTPGFEHVLNAELADVWKVLQPGDVLVFYQHQTNRNGQQWVEPKKEQFEQALGLSAGAAKIARSEKISRDVVFFYVQKGQGTGVV